MNKKDKLVKDFLDRQLNKERFNDFIKFFEEEGWRKRKEHSYYVACDLKCHFFGEGNEINVDKEIATQISKHYDLEVGSKVSFNFCGTSEIGVIEGLRVEENCIYFKVLNEKGFHVYPFVSSEVINLFSEKVKIVKRSKSEVTKETFELFVDGKLHYYADFYEDNKIIDSLLRDENGDNVDDPILLERIQDAID